MEQLILDIKIEMKKQGLTTPKLLKRMGVSEEKEVRKTNRLLSGDTKRLDLGFVHKIQETLGMVAESPVEYCAGRPQKQENPRLKVAYELLNEESDEELEELIFKLLQKKKARGGGLQQE